MKILASFPKQHKEVLTTLIQRPTFKQKNSIFKFSWVQHLSHIEYEAPPDGYQVTKTTTRKGSKTYMPPCFDASKASHVSITLQMPKVTNQMDYKGI